MTTRQDLIEQDCMDRLGWDVSRVAAATEEEMVRALSEHDRGRGARVRSPSPVAVSPLLLPPSVHASPRVAELPRAAACPGPTDPEIRRVHSLRESLRMKSAYLQSVEVLDDDMGRLRESVHRTHQQLAVVLAALRKRLAAVRAEEHQKRQLHALLAHVVQSVGDDDDRTHLHSVHTRLTALGEEGERLVVALGPDREAATGPSCPNPVAAV